MKRTILAVIIAMSSVSAFANQGDAHQAAVSNSVHQSGGFHAAGSAQSATRDASAHAPVASQQTGFSKAMETANTVGGRVTAASALATANGPVASQQTGYSQAMETANTVGGRVTTASAIATAPAAAPSQPAAAPAAAPAQAASPTATVGEALDGKQTNSSMNVAASSLNPNMDVKTDAGVVKAGSLPADAQVKVGMDSVFAGAPAKKGGHESNHSSHSEHGTGNGGNNAANSNSAHGLGGGNHIGGGSAQSGSRNVGHW